MKQNILIVDDDPAVLELLKDFLVDKEFNVITAKNGEDALGKYGDNFNGIVISDLDMPVMDGIELLKRLKKRDTDCIGIILTGHGTMETCTKSLSEGLAYDYLLKPLDNLDLLLSACRRAWEKKELELQNRNLIESLKKSNEELQMASMVFENCDEGIIVTDKEGVTQKVNPAFTTITGYSVKEAVGKKISILKSDRHDQEFYEKMWDDLIHKDYWQGEIWNRNATGEVFLEWITITAIKNAAGSTIKYAAVFYDITESKNQQDQIRHQAYHCALTRLPNRALFLDRLTHAIDKEKRSKNILAVLFLDLDRFKKINDSLGHHVGDLLLVETSLRLMECLRKEDTVSRRGGDEFTILLENYKTVTEHLNIVQRIKNCMCKPFKLKNHEVHTSVSIGIAIFPSDGSDPEELIKNADIAMYRAKEKGRNNCQFYSQFL